ncbi:crotonase/enoyl-CoA hydratase family protein [Methylophaga thiooxydans]|uniref:Enoyl-CoA hydratase/isomerase family protein n=1 Tax=Methylophaga thiooxydans DMS010 TaxID=637616 RepID=C0N6D5_9GAMM|nr:crotonase/enoyl-CoA hydratase family protein [Methylophaga thiooxydans]EEF79184.1 enoyl-CoA hydratase/isomerase family protein [Methylophaga thiooxydans DMS010]
MNATAHLNENKKVDSLQSLPEKREYEQLSTHYDAKYKVGWFYMMGSPRPCFTPTLLNELTDYLSSVKTDMAATDNEKYDYLVVGSKVDGVFNLGGDLDLFMHLIEQKNRQALFSYAMHCVDILYDNMSHFGSDLTTISLIQGDALGGGFEASLSSNVIIAERGVKMGLPEVLFNLFPGMGAYSLLSRKVGPRKAEEMILSGKLYTAEEMYEMGAIDILAEKGEGELALYRYIKNAQKSPNTYKAMSRVKDICNPVSYEELSAIAGVWADAALNLTAKDVRMMSRLVNRQSAKEARRQA